MSKRQVTTVNFMRGHQDTQPEDGLPYPGWRTFYDLRVAEGGAKRRKGMFRVARSGSLNKALDFVAASSQYVAVPVDTRVWKLGTQFTIEGLFDLDAVAGTLTFIYAGVTTPSIVIDTAASKLRVRVWDTDATTTTVTSADDLTTAVTSFQFVRDGTALTLRLNNSATSGGTGTMSAKALRTPAGEVRFARDTGSNYLDGRIDYLRGFAIPRPNHRDDYLRFADPWASYVLFDYDFNKTSVEHLVDRSRYGNTGRIYNAPAEATALALQTAPVNLIHGYRTRSGEKRVLVTAGNQIYDGSI